MIFGKNRKIFLFSAFVAAFTLVASIKEAFPNPYFAQIRLPEKDFGPTPSIKFLNLTPEVKQNNEELLSRLYVELLGVSLSLDSTILSGTALESTVLQLDQYGVFQLTVPITGKENKFSMVVINAFGELEEREFVLLFPDFEILQKTTILAEETERLRLTPGLSWTHLNYQEPGRTKVSESLLVGKLTSDYFFKNSPYSLSGSFYSSFFILGHTAQSSVHMAGATVRMGYRVPLPIKPWEFRLYVGSYYATTFGGSGDFGYSGLWGPQFASALSYTFHDQARLEGYLKYSALANKFGLYSTQNFEWSAGGTYYFKKNLGISLEGSWLNLRSAVGNLQFRTTSLGAVFKF